jgi:hypothetical protein
LPVIEFDCVFTGIDKVQILEPLWLIAMLAVFGIALRGRDKFPAFSRPETARVARQPGIVCCPCYEKGHFSSFPGLKPGALERRIQTYAVSVKCGAVLLPQRRRGGAEFRREERQKLTIYKSKKTYIYKEKEERVYKCGCTTSAVLRVFSASLR